MASDQTNTVDLTGSLPTDDMYLLADNVEDFTFKLVKNKKSDKYTVNFSVKFNDSVSEYSLDNICCAITLSLYIRLPVRKHTKSGNWKAQGLKSANLSWLTQVGGIFSGNNFDHHQ